MCYYRPKEVAIIPTIKDVAKHADVSIASVSNFLNNKPGLGEKTAARIENSIQTLGYVVRSAARDLRAVKSGDIHIIFPNISEPYLEKLINSIKGYLTHRNQRFILLLTDADPVVETRAVIDAIGKKATGIILYSCQKEDTSLFNSLETSGIPYVLIDRNPTNKDCNFVTVDSEILFEKLILKCYKQRLSEIVLVLGPLEYAENQHAVLGATRSNALKKNTDSNIEIIHTTPIRECGFKAGIQIFEKKIPQVIITNSYMLAEGLRYAMRVHHLRPGRDIQIVCTGDCVHDVFYNDNTISKTSRPSFEMGEAVGQLLLSNIKSPIVFEKETHIFKDDIPPINPAVRHSVSCNDEDKREKTKTIKVLLIDEDTSVNSLKQLLVDFYAKEKVKVEIVGVKPQEQFSFIADYYRSGRNDIDVFMFDIPWLPYFASRGFLYPLNELIDDYKVNFEHYIPGLLSNFGEYQNKLYALPCLACVQLLFYRKDLFESEALRRDFERQYHLTLRRPKDWTYYNTLARFFTKQFNCNSPTEYGHSMTCSYPENVICDIMPRLWSYRGDLLTEKNTINVDTQPMLKSLKSILESVKYSTPQLFQDNPHDTVNRFRDGDCAMVYTYHYFAVGIVDRIHSKVYNDYAVTPIPGNSVLAGWSLGIAHNSKNIEAAFRFVRWASDSDISIPQTILGGQSPTLSVYKNYDLASLYPWLPLALSEFKNCRLRKTPYDYYGIPRCEKNMENTIIKTLLPLLKNVHNNEILETEYLKTVLRDLQKKLE